MACMNNRVGPPQRTNQYWLLAVGATTSLVDADTGLCARAVIVGALGTLVMVDIYGATRTFTAADIIAANYIIRGQWTSIVNTSTAFTLTVWW